MSQAMTIEAEAGHTPHSRNLFLIAIAGVPRRAALSYADQIFKKTHTMKPTKPKTEITSTQLSAETHIDRHRVRQALANLQPLRARGAVRFYDKGEALRAVENHMAERGGTTPGKSTGPAVNPLRLVSNNATAAAFEFLSYDKFGFPEILGIAKRLGIDQDKAEKLLTELWLMCAIRMKVYIDEQGVDRWLERSGGTDLDSLHRKIWGTDAAPWRGESQEFPWPDLIERLIKKHSPKE